MILRVNKDNFCFVVIEFQLVYVHRMTYISDTVLYTQLCDIDITIFERYVELRIISVEMIVDSMTSYYLRSGEMYNRYKMGPRTEPCGTSTIRSLTDVFV